MSTALFAAYLSIQRRLQCIVPDKRATPNLNCGGVSNFAQSSPKFKRAMRLGNNRASSRRPRLQGDYLADRGCMAFDTATEERADKDGSNPRGEGKNNAAEFPAKTAGCPEGLITARPSIMKTLSFWSRFPDRACEGTTVRAPSIGVRLFRPRRTFSSDAWKAVYGRLSSRNGLLEQIPPDVGQGL
jgi:hypothetical protein